MKFSGSNRIDNLKVLRSIYEKVAVEAERPNPFDTAADVQQVVLVKAEPGLGKTRLVMELYNWLQSIQPDKSCYWPKLDLESLDNNQITPPSSRCNIEVRSSFLWWGIQLQESQGHEQNLYSNISNLRPHLVQSLAASLTRKRNRSNLFEIGDLSLDQSISDLVIQIGEESVGIGALKRIAESIWRIGKNQVKIQTNLDSLIDSVLDDLSVLFNVNSEFFAGQTLIIFIDDAHFVDYDTSMKVFLEKLLIRSKKERWPLLLLFTHWERQYYNWENSEGLIQERSYIARLLENVRNSNPNSLGEFSNHLRESLESEQITIIDLSDPVIDLAPALKSVFEGIDSETVKKIVDKTGGNPRKLEQIIIKMKDTPIWFTDNSFSQNLTPLGLEETLKLSNLRIDEIILKRLREAPKLVKQSVSIASILGQKFVISLVEKLSENSIGTENIADQLEKAQTQFHFFNNISPTNIDKIASFHQRIFYDSAISYRNQGLASFELENWPGDTKLLNVLDELLCNYVTDGLLNSEYTLNAQVEILNLAFNRMEVSSHPLTGLALTELVLTENKRGNPEGATEASERFYNGLINKKWDLNLIPHVRTMIVADTFARVNQIQKSLNVFKIQHKHIIQSLRENKTEIKNYYDIAMSYSKLYEKNKSLGNTKHRLLFVSFRILKKLNEIQPENKLWQRDLSQRYYEIGLVEAYRKDFRKARSYVQSSIEKCIRIIRTYHDKKLILTDLSISYSMLARIDRWENNIDRAIRYSYEAINYSTKAINEYNDVDGTIHQNLAIILDDLGEYQSSNGQFEKAKECHNKSLNIRLLLTEEDQSNSHWLMELSSSYLYLADLENKLTAPNRSQQEHNYYNCIKIREKLCSEDPSNVHIKHRYLDALMALGDFYLISRNEIEKAKGRNQDCWIKNYAAKENYSKALSIAEELYRTNKLDEELMQTLNFLRNHYGYR